MARKCNGPDQMSLDICDPLSQAITALEQIAAYLPHETTTTDLINQAITALQQIEESQK